MAEGVGLGREGVPSWIAGVAELSSGEITWAGLLSGMGSGWSS